MAEETKIAQPVTPTAAVTSPAPSAAAPSSETPVAPTPVAADAPKADAAPVQPETPKPAEPAADAPKVEEPGAQSDAVKPHTDEPTLLETVGKDDKPKAETKPEGGDGKVETKAGEKPGEKPPEAPQPVTYEIKAPEGITFDAELLKPVRELFGKHNIPQEVGQELMTLHANEMLRYTKLLAEQTLAEQHKVFAETRAKWRKEIQADPILGGAGYQTSSRAVKRMVQLFVPAAEEQAFNDFMRLTGAGDHPVFWRMLHRMSQKYDEGAPTPTPTNPAPDRGRPSGRGARRAALYDHPRSPHGANGAA